tara:strand:- start:1698 stop:2129 length:432 start_codon:yes stop_codon:yes gene_type:complete
MKVNLRMNLSHFLNESFEEQVIEKLHDIHKDSIKYYLTLWYEDGALNPTDVKNFIEKYESRLHFKTNIVVGNNLKSNDFIWFDITDRSNVSDNNRLRFQYIYNNRKDILKGLNEYHSCAKFCTSEKPPKRQKRNDYESSDSRK